MGYLNILIDKKRGIYAISAGGDDCPDVIEVGEEPEVIDMVEDKKDIKNIKRIGNGILG